MSKKTAAIILGAIIVVALVIGFRKFSARLEPSAQATQTKATARKGPRAVNPARSTVPGFRLENPRFEDGQDEVTHFTVYNDTEKDVRAFMFGVDYHSNGYGKTRYNSDGSAVLPSHSELSTYIETDNVPDDGVIELKAVEFMDGTTLGTAKAVDMMNHRRHPERGAERN